MGLASILHKFVLFRPIVSLPLLELIATGTFLPGRAGGKLALLEFLSLNQLLWKKRPDGSESAEGGV